MTGRSASGDRPGLAVRLSPRRQSIGWIAATSVRPTDENGAWIEPESDKAVWVNGYEFQAPRKCLRLIAMYAISFIP
jgi:hypothetical protein